MGKATESLYVSTLGEVDVILRIKIIRDGNGIKLRQSHYIEKVLKKLYVFDETAMSTPMDQHV